MYFILRHCDISCKMMSLIDTGLYVSHTFFSDLYEILVLIGLFMPHNHTLRCTGTIRRLLFLFIGKLRHRSEKCLTQDQMIRCLDIWRTWTWIHPLTKSWTVFTLVIPDLGKVVLNTPSLFLHGLLGDLEAAHGGGQGQGWQMCKCPGS